MVLAQKSFETTILFLLVNFPCVDDTRWMFLSELRFSINWLWPDIFYLIKEFVKDLEFPGRWSLKTQQENIPNLEF